MSNLKVDAFHFLQKCLLSKNKIKITNNVFMHIMFKGSGGQCVGRSYEDWTFVNYVRTGSAIDHSGSFSLMNILRSHTNYNWHLCCKSHDLVAF